MRCLSKQPIYGESNVLIKHMQVYEATIIRTFLGATHTLYTLTVLVVFRPHGRVWWYRTALVGHTVLRSSGNQTSLPTATRVLSWRADAPGGRCRCDGSKLLRSPFRVILKGLVGIVFSTAAVSW